MRRFNWWRFAAIFISACYIFSTFSLILIHFFHIESSPIYFIATYCGIFYDEMFYVPVFWIPVLLGILGILGAVFQNERTAAERVCFALIPCSGAIISLLYIFPLYTKLSFMTDIIPVILTLIIILWIAVDMILSTAMSRKKK